MSSHSGKMDRHVSGIFFRFEAGVELDLLRDERFKDCLSDGDSFSGVGPFLETLLLNLFPF